jgi:cation:H+ antiporter
VLIAIGAISALVLLVLASDAFTNAVEWVGALYSMARGTVGSVVAAIGSSLPETAIAFVALVVLRDPASQAVGIGAVLGAPFMLATAVFAVIGIIALARTRDSSGDCNVRVGMRSTRFGLGLFALTFALVIGASFEPTSIVRPVVAVLIVIAYVVFVTYSMRDSSAESREEPPPPPLRFAPRAQRPAPALVFLQLLLSLCLTVAASHWFVTSLAAASTAFGVAPLVLSLFLSPIATELPELLNVVIWMRRGLDDYAVGNVIGAMMFQTSIASAIALLATPWVIGRDAYAAAIATFAAVIIVLCVSQMRDHLNSWALTACGVLYGLYLWYAIAVH